jgi:hypothetical protein
MLTSARSHLAFRSFAPDLLQTSFCSFALALSKELAVLGSVDQFTATPVSDRPAQSPDVKRDRQSPASDQHDASYTDYPRR